MLSTLGEESDDFFSLLIRVEKAELKNMQSQSAYIEVRHLQNQPRSKTSPKKQTNAVSVNNPVWMQDLEFQSVSSSDEFIFALLNDNYLVVAQNKMNIRELMQFLNTGQLLEQKITLRSKQGDVGDLIVSFSLFQPKEPIAGVFPLELSLDPNNLRWETLRKKNTVLNPISHNYLCSCFDGDRVQGFDETSNTYRITANAVK